MNNTSITTVNQSSEGFTFAEISDKIMYQCQCCQVKQTYHFKMTKDGLCPRHGYPLHPIGTVDQVYRSLRPADTRH